MRARLMQILSSLPSSSTSTVLGARTRVNHECVFAPRLTKSDGVQVSARADRVSESTEFRRPEKRREEKRKEAPRRCVSPGERDASEDVSVSDLFLSISRPYELRTGMSCVRARSRLNLQPRSTRARTSSFLPSRHLSSSLSALTPDARRRAPRDDRLRRVTCVS